MGRSRTSRGRSSGSVYQPTQFALLRELQEPHPGLWIQALYHCCDGHLPASRDLTRCTKSTSMAGNGRPAQDRTA